MSSENLRHIALPFGASWANSRHIAYPFGSSSVNSVVITYSFEISCKRNDTHSQQKDQVKKLRLEYLSLKVWFYNKDSAKSIEVRILAADSFSFSVSHSFKETSKRFVQPWRVTTVGVLNATGRSVLYSPSNNGVLTG